MVVFKELGDKDSEIGGVSVISISSLELSVVSVATFSSPESVI
jgi:hypothetical protein